MHPARGKTARNTSRMPKKLLLPLCSSFMRLRGPGHGHVGTASLGFRAANKSLVAGPQQKNCLGIDFRTCCLAEVWRRDRRTQQERKVVAADTANLLAVHLAILSLELSTWKPVPFHQATRGCAVRVGVRPCRLLTRPRCQGLRRTSGSEYSCRYGELHLYLIQSAPQLGWTAHVTASRLSPNQTCNPRNPTLNPKLKHISFRRAPTQRGARCQSRSSHCCGTRTPGGGRGAASRCLSGCLQGLQG